MNEWWKKAEFAPYFGEGQQSQQQVVAGLQQYQQAASSQPAGMSQQMGANNNSARQAIGQGAVNASIDKSNKMAAQMQSNANPPGYTGAGPNGVVEPTKRVATADTHEGEFVLNADATQAIGSDVLQGLQDKAQSGSLDVNNLRTVIGQPERAGYELGGAVTTTPPIGSGLGAKVYNRTIGFQTPEDKAKYDQRTDEAWGWNQTGMKKLEGVATGNDPLYAYQKNALAQDIGGAGAAGTAGARQQAAQAGYSPTQLQSIGIQTQRANLGKQSEELTKLSTDQQKMAIVAAESLQGRAVPLAQYFEGSESRAVDLENKKVRFDIDKQGYETMMDNKFGAEFLAALGRARQKNPNATDAEIMNDPGVSSAWANYAPTKGMKADDLNAFQGEARIGSQGEAKTAWNNFLASAAGQALKPEDLPAIEQSFAWFYTTGEFPVIGADGSIKLGADIIKPADDVPEGEISDSSSGLQMAQTFGATGDAKTFWETPNNIYAPALIELANGNPELQAEVDSWGDKPIPGSTNWDANNIEEFRALSKDAQDALLAGKTSFIPSKTEVNTLASELNTYMQNKSPTVDDWSRLSSDARSIIEQSSPGTGDRFATSSVSDGAGSYKTGTEIMSGINSGLIKPKTRSSLMAPLSWGYDEDYDGDKRGRPLNNKEQIEEQKGVVFRYKYGNTDGYAYINGITKGTTPGQGGHGAMPGDVLSLTIINKDGSTYTLNMDGPTFNSLQG